ncbi:MAG: TonB-dependent receptor [Chitinophagales bacterium]|nr:TonB-dependent receptor [Chitinophagales bacterium]
MPSIRFFLIGLLLAIVHLSYAQTRYTLSGSITDKVSGEQLIGAIVRIAENKSIGTTTNEYGFYSLTLPEGNYTVLISSLGYAEQTLSVQLDKDIRQNLQLQQESQQLNEVVVSATSTNDRVTEAQMGVEKLDIKELNMIPVLFGERDILKTIQLLPGVKSAGEGNSGYFVRGGTTDQNLILLDEAVVYNPSHLLGFFSTFNSDAIKDATLYKGGMPAQYGGRLASVLDVKMNEGNNQRYQVSGGIGLISSKLNVEGPIVKNKGSFLVSGRRTYADVFLKLSPDTTISRNQLYFYDINAKLNYKLGQKDQLYLSGYFGKDKLGLEDLFGINWGNTTATLRWNHIINDRWFSNTSFIYSDYNYNIDINAGGVEATIHSAIRDLNLKQEFQFYPNPNSSWRFGANSIYHTITPGEFTGDFSISNLPDTYSWENALYATSSWKATEKLNIDYGLRLSIFSSLKGSNFYELNDENEIIDTLATTKAFVKTYANPEPRLNASYLINEHSSIKAGYARNSQYLHLITNSTTGSPTDKWVPTNNIIRPEIADQVSLGYFLNFHKNMFELSIETYYKAMQNQVDYKNGANVNTNDPIEPELLFGRGRAYGIELLLKKKTGKFTGWVGYTLSRTERQITEINGGNWYPARQDRTHDLSFVGIYSINKKWTVSASFVYYTGSAVSFPSGKYEVNNNIVFYYTERNGYRMPAYHRLDLGATLQLKKHKHYSSELAFSLYNAYGRENAYVITFEQSETDPNVTQAVQTSLFRWVPSISYNFKIF